MSSTTLEMPINKTDTVKVYANSLARYKYFKSHFSTTHPTCEAEFQLLELNEARLRREILDEYTAKEVDLVRKAIEQRIYHFVLKKLQDITEDDHTITRLMRDIKSSDFDSLFTFHS